MITGYAYSQQQELPRRIIQLRKPLAEKREILVQRRHEIRLPQMANAALSENWLLKEIGDVHWELVSRGLEQPSSSLQNAEGERLCAAFVRIRYSMSPLNHFRENEWLDLQGKIRRFGTSVYQSDVTGYSNDQVLKAQLMSCFSAVGRNNNHISKSSPVSAVNHVDTTEQAPDMLGEFRRVRKQHTGILQSGDHAFDLTDRFLDSHCYTINPYYEVNGVGLLYFAAYPFISDQCTLHYLSGECPELAYAKNYHTIHRDIFYYANCNAQDRIVHRVNSIETLGIDRIRVAASLYRASDGQLMARIFTVKQSTVYEEHRVLWSRERE